MHEMDETIFNKVRDFTVSELWPIKCKITPDTRIAHDFGVAGLDGYDYMEAFSKKFDVDLTDFNWGYYFGPEQGISPISLILYLYLKIRGNRENSCNLPSITIGHLVECVQKGKWFEPNNEQHA
jgi:hypothetical protein